MLTVAILSLGEMGLGISQVLLSKRHRVITSSVDRSESTLERVRKTSIELFHDDIALVQAADCLLSIVPPRAALSIGRRVSLALHSAPIERNSPLFYLDLNAISPSTAKELALYFAPDDKVKFLDGSIIGGPPVRKTNDDGLGGDQHSWSLPSILISGPYPVPRPLATDLSIRSISEEIGQASALKMCFASLTKGFTALAIQSFTTAKAMGVFSELKNELDLHAPDLLARAEKGIIACPPKAYRWIWEMEEIGNTFASAGFGEGEARGASLFPAVAEVYRFLSEDTKLTRIYKDTPAMPSTEEIAEECAASLKKRSAANM